MRSLTTAEARVIGELLARSPGSEAERIRRSRVPRTTFQTIRRRLFISGWIRERYLPAPSAVGAGSVTFRLAQPFAERRADLVRRWRDDASVVVLWASPDSLFSVSYDPSPGRAPEAAVPSDAGPTTNDGIRRHWSITAVPEESGVQVYFDYEGAWTRRAGSDSPTSYPQRFPLGPKDATAPAPRELAALLAHPFSTGPWEGLPIRLGAADLPRRQRRLVDQGWVAHRVLPNLAEIPPFRGAREERVVLITGLLRDAAYLDRLRSDLYQECRVAPFLAVHGQGRVLLGTLSPAPIDSSSRPRPVLGTLERALREIEIVREPVDTFFPVVDHRYDRLVGDPTPIEGPLRSRPGRFAGA